MPPKPRLVIVSDASTGGGSKTSDDASTSSRVPRGSIVSSFGSSLVRQRNRQDGGRGTTTTYHEVSESKGVEPPTVHDNPLFKKHPAEDVSLRFKKLVQQAQAHNSHGSAGAGVGVSGSVKNKILAWATYPLRQASNLNTLLYTSKSHDGVVQFLPRNLPQYLHKYLPDLKLSETHILDAEPARITLPKDVLGDEFYKVLEQMELLSCLAMSYLKDASLYPARGSDLKAVLAVVQTIKKIILSDKQIALAFQSMLEHKPIQGLLETITLARARNSGSAQLRAAQSGLFFLLQDLAVFEAYADSVPATKELLAYMNKRAQCLRAGKACVSDVNRASPELSAVFGLTSVMFESGFDPGTSVSTPKSAPVLQVLQVGVMRDPVSGVLKLIPLDASADDRVAHGAGADALARTSDLTGCLLPLLVVKNADGQICVMDQSLMGDDGALIRDLTAEDALPISVSAEGDVVVLEARAEPSKSSVGTAAVHSAGRAGVIVRLDADGVLVGAKDAHVDARVHGAVDSSLARLVDLGLPLGNVAADAELAWTPVRGDVSSEYASSSGTPGASGAVGSALKRKDAGAVQPSVGARPSVAVSGATSAAGTASKVAPKSTRDVFAGAHIQIDADLSGGKKFAHAQLHADLAAVRKYTHRLLKSRSDRSGLSVRAWELSRNSLLENFAHLFFYLHRLGQNVAYYATHAGEYDSAFNHIGLNFFKQVKDLLTGIGRVAPLGRFGKGLGAHDQQQMKLLRTHLDLLVKMILYNFEILENYTPRVAVVAPMGIEMLSLNNDRFVECIFDYALARATLDKHMQMKAYFNGAEGREVFDAFSVTVGTVAAVVAHSMPGQNAAIRSAARVPVVPAAKKVVSKEASKTAKKLMDSARRKDRVNKPVEVVAGSGLLAFIMAMIACAVASGSSSGALDARRWLSQHVNLFNSLCGCGTTRIHFDGFPSGVNATAGTFQYFGNASVSARDECDDPYAGLLTVDVTATTDSGAAVLLADGSTVQSISGNPVSLDAVGVGASADAIGHIHMSANAAGLDARAIDVPVSVQGASTALPSSSVAPSVSSSLAPSVSSVASPSATATASLTNGVSASVTATQTMSASGTPTMTMTVSVTRSVSGTGSGSASGSETSSLTFSVSPSSSATGTRTSTATVSLSPTETATITAIQSVTGSVSTSVSVSSTASVSPTASGSSTASNTATFSVSSSPTSTSSGTPTDSPSVTVTPTPSLACMSGSNFTSNGVSFNILNVAGGVTLRRNVTASLYSTIVGTGCGPLITLNDTLGNPYLLQTSCLGGTIGIGNSSLGADGARAAAVVNVVQLAGGGICNPVSRLSLNGAPPVPTYDNTLSAARRLQEEASCEEGASATVWRPLTAEDLGIKREPQPSWRVGDVRGLRH